MSYDTVAVTGSFGKDTLDSIPSFQADSSKSDDKRVPYHDDMVKALLERGTKLRDAMAIQSGSENYDLPLTDRSSKQDVMSRTTSEK